MIELKDIQISFDNRECIRNGHFIAYPHQITAIYGESGTGKSSLLYVIGMLSSQKHEYYYHHQRLELDDQQKAEFRNQHISFVIQNSMLIETISVDKNIQFYLEQSNVSYSVDELLDLVHMSDKKNAMPNSLSGGERQRVAIACALAKDSDIILGDELTSALDEENKTMVMELLRQCAEKGKTVIIVSHEKKVIEECDRIYRLDHLELLLEKESTEISQNEITETKTSKKCPSWKMFELLFYSNRKNNFRRILMSFMIIALLLTSVSILVVGYKNAQLTEYSLDNVSQNKVLVLSDESGEFHNIKMGYGIRKPERYEFISEDNIKAIESLDHIESIYDYYSFGRMITGTSGDTGTKLTATRNGEIVEKRQSTDEYYVGKSDYNFSVIPIFPEESIYSEEDGVYVNSNVAFYHQLEVGDTVELEMGIPYAMLREVNEVVDEDLGLDTPYYPVHCLGEKVTYTTKVLGIIEANSEGGCEIHMKYDVMQSMIDEQIERYKNGEINIRYKEFEGYSEIIDLQPYAKAVFVDKTENVLEVKNKINQISDKIFAYNEYESVLELMDESRDASMYAYKVTCVGVVLFILGALVIERMYFNKYKSTYMMMNLIGYDKKEKIKINLWHMLWQLLIIMVWGALIYVTASLPDILVSLHIMGEYEVWQYVNNIYNLYMVYFRFTKIRCMMFVVSSIIIVCISQFMVMRRYDKMDITSWIRGG